MAQVAVNKKKDEIQIGTMRSPCMIVSFGSEFDGPKARSTSARVAVTDAATIAALQQLDKKSSQEAQAQGREYSSFITGESKDGTAPIIRVKITRKEQGYTGAEENGAPASVLELEDGCSVLLKVSPFTWTREDERFGPKLGVTLYANAVHCPGRMDNFKLMESEVKKKREVKWD